MAKLFLSDDEKVIRILQGVCIHPCISRISYRKDTSVWKCGICGLSELIFIEHSKELRLPVDKQ